MTQCRNIAIVATLLAFCASGILGAGPAASQPGESQPSALKIPQWPSSLPANYQVKFEAAPLRDVLDWFRDAGGLPLLVRWQNLKTVGIDEVTPVTAAADDLPFDTALWTVLQAASTPSAPLDFAVKDGVIIVSTAEDLSLPQFRVTSICDVGDLIDAAEPEQASSLILMIQENVAPDTWPPAQNIGSIRYLNGLLTVTQTYRNQCAVQKLLADFRKAGPKITPSPAAQQQAELRAKLVGNMKETCYDPKAMGIVAVGGLRTEVPLQREQLVATLENLLSRTKSLGLRNAIRLTLKDLYVEAGDAAKTQAQLEAMVSENDQAIQSRQTAAPER